MTTSWAVALDQFEARLAATRAVLDDAGDPPSGAWPPADIVTEPIPSALVDRARALLGEAFVLEEALVARRDTMSSLRSRSRPRPRRRGKRSANVSADL